MDDFPSLIRLFLGMFVLGVFSVSLSARSPLPTYHRAFPAPAALPNAEVDLPSAPQDYTVMFVYRVEDTIHPQQLWKLQGSDNTFYAMTTSGMITNRSVSVPAGFNNASRLWRIYTVKHTIPQKDNTEERTWKLGIGANPQDSQTVNNNFELYEVAYFDKRLTRKNALICQTYLAVKYGITLDKSNYIDQKGQVIWNAGKNADFYHRIHGIANDNNPYNLYRSTSFSVEDSLLTLSALSQLPSQTYVLAGDNDRSLTWNENTDNTAFNDTNIISVLNRQWLLQKQGNIDKLNILLDLTQLPSVDDNDLNRLAHTLRLQADSLIITPDSLHDNRYLCFATPLTGTSAKLSLLTSKTRLPFNAVPDDLEEENENTILYPLHSDDIDIQLYPNPTPDNFFVSVRLPQITNIRIVIRDVAGKTIEEHERYDKAEYLFEGQLLHPGLYLVSVYKLNGSLLATKELLVQ